MWWHTETHGRGSEGKLANRVCSQYSLRYLGTWCIQHYYRWCAHLGCQQSTELTPPPISMDSSFSAKDEMWFLRVCHHVSNALYYQPSIVTRALGLVWGNCNIRRRGGSLEHPHSHRPCDLFPWLQHSCSIQDMTSCSRNITYTWA